MHPDWTPPHFLRTDDHIMQSPDVGLAGDLFQLAIYRSPNCEPIISQEVWRRGLAAALLCEVDLIGRLEIKDKRVHAVDLESRAADWLQMKTLTKIRHTDISTVADWILALSYKAEHEVAERLELLNLVHREKIRKLISRQPAVAYRPMQGHVLDLPAIRLSHHVMRLIPFNSWHDVALLALVDAVGLTNEVFFTAEDVHRRWIQRNAEIILQDERLCAIIAEATRLIDTALVTHRA